MKTSVRSAFSVVSDLDKFIYLLWGLALLTLPVTSFRWFPFLDNSALVRPLALYPLALLLPLLLVQAWHKRTSLHWANALIPLGAFLLFVFVATILGILNDPIPLRGQDYIGRSIRALATLMIGVAFFVGAAWMNKTEADFRFTVKWIFAGLCLNLAWSGLQAATFYTGLIEKETVTHWQLAFSMRELVRTNRISGLAYEPAWLAGQLATIFIPFLFAAILTEFRLTQRGWLEPVLLVLTTLVLLATYSRGGLLTTVAAAGLTFLFLGRDVLRPAWTWFTRGVRGHITGILLRVALLVVVVGGIAGALLFLGQRDYFRSLVNFEADSLSEYMVNIRAGARGAYSSAAFAVFEEHPFSGVGLGASGFTMYQNLPNWSLTTVPEIARQLSTDNRLYPNPKNMYARLLAETGLIGFFLFLAFQFHVLGDALSLLKRSELWARFAATAGVFAWLAITFYNFTQDSLTTPNVWLVSGILVGLSATSLHKEIT
ncbi:MAG: O-antigen ligase family protein [Anaerolineales bacterium]|nr:MAG: O-antigen ligase family protein [Anaerolineales bacterium]